MYCCTRAWQDGTSGWHERSCTAYWQCGCKKRCVDGDVVEFEHACPKVQRHVFDEHLNDAELAGGADGVLRLRFGKAPDSVTLQKLKSFMRWDPRERWWTCPVTARNVELARELGNATRGCYDGPRMSRYDGLNLYDPDPDDPDWWDM